jgi:hypothetical protein
LLNEDGGWRVSDDGGRFPANDEKQYVKEECETSKAFEVT